MASIADISPYLYLATFFFALSACSSDLLFIRFSLTFGFLFLVLASLTGHATNGSFAYIPLSDGIIDVTMLVNMILFGLNFFICARLIGDECCCYHPTLTEQEKALFRFFQSRCGLTPLQFHYILRNGHFLELPAHTNVPDCHCILYLVLEGKVSCTAKMFTSNSSSNNSSSQSSNSNSNHHHHYHGFDDGGKTFFKRSGQFFDIKLFNLFTFPVGFDTKEFHATTVTRTKFFCWELDGLLAMRDLQSPNLKPYWEYIVLRSLTGIAVQHHLNAAQDTLYDSLLVPEHKNWLEGAPSRDFWKQEKPVGNWKHVKRQLGILRDSLWHIIPPHGVRHQPAGVVGTNPKQAYMELVCKAAVADREAPCSFPEEDVQTNNNVVESHDVEEAPTSFTFLSQQMKKHEPNVESDDMCTKG